MSSINPLYIFEIVKQKVDWGTILTPVNKIHDVLETFNSTDNKTLILNGKDLSNNVVECKDTIPESETFKNLDLGKDIKVILANLKNACIVKDADGTQKIRVEMDILGTDKRITDLIKPTSSEKDIIEALQDAKIKVKKYGYVKIGKSSLSSEKKDILGLITALLTQEYEKSTNKDGKLSQEIKGEIGIINSEKQKFVELLDMTDVKNNPKLCDVSDIQLTNIISVTNIKTIRVLDEGKSYCLDLHTSKSYQQNRILTVDTTEPIKTNMKTIRETNGTNDESMDDSENDKRNGESAQDSLKKSVLDSYIANYLSSVYKDKDKWTVEWMRLTDTSILIKIKNKDDKELIFHKFDASDAILETGSCPEYKIDPKVREFIYFQEFCKKDTQYKLKYGLVGTQNSMIVGLKVSFVKLVEARSKQELENFKRNIGNFDKAYYTSTLPYYNTFAGLYNLGLYNSGVYTYPYSYSSIIPYYGTYYVPPVVSTIVPTAPVVSQVPYTYTYPPVTSMYSLGSYYAPYTYSYISPYTYSYTSPYRYYIKSEVPMTIRESEQNYRRLIKTETDEFDKFRNVKYVVPSKVSTIRDLSNHLIDNNMKSINIEKISNYLYKVEFEKQYIKHTHYYSFENDGLYHVSQNINKKLI